MILQYISAIDDQSSIVGRYSCYKIYTQCVVYDPITVSSRDSSNPSGVNIRSTKYFFTSNLCQSLTSSNHPSGNQYIHSREERSKQQAASSPPNMLQQSNDDDAKWYDSLPAHAKQVRLNTLLCSRLNSFFSRETYSEMEVAPRNSTRLRRRPPFPKLSGSRRMILLIQLTGDGMQGMLE